ncbi:SctD/MshK family protein [Aestuariispira insulae]|uniref:Type III secretion system (T3SS) inner membrane Yop/YscD-like protein n=1 Tax=Aestuariispira insulae TaxID=1461337 RepID=A0A3D9H2H5_9PROT|nr:FHA domain-containing protein [Aestuariispira insulae]RED43699.1 type III secretion system (T3SS) inner membrane Yop/YscD-like protein [Aestuariispira insulae]
MQAVCHTQDTLSLKVSRGLQEGASYQMHAGKYSVGSDLDCDIILFDQAIEKLHLELEVHPERLDVKPKQGAVFADKRKVEQETVSYSQNVQLVLGETILKIEFPEIAAMPEKSDLAMPATEKGALPASLSGPRPRAALLGFAAVGLIAAVSFGSMMPAEPPSQHDNSAMEQADHTGIAAEVSRVTEPAQYSAPGPVADLNLEQYAEAARELIAGLNYKLTVKISSAQEILVIGIVREEQDLVRLKKALQTDLPGFLPLDFQGVRSLRYLAAILDKSVRQSGLSEALTVGLDAGTIRVEGVLSPVQQAAWRKIERSILHPYAGMFTPAINISLASGPLLEIEAIWAGAEPYAILADKRSYSVGAVLKDGWIIRKIDQDGIRLERDGHQALLELKPGKANQSESQKGERR